MKKAQAKFNPDGMDDKAETRAAEKSNMKDIEDRTGSLREDGDGTKFMNETLATPIRSNTSTKHSTSHKKRSLFTSKPSPSKIRGLMQKKGGKWEVQCYNNGVRRYIGRVNTREEGIKILKKEGHDDLVQVDTEALNENGSTSYGNKSETNDDSTIDTEEEEKDNVADDFTNDDDTTDSGNTEGDTTDGETEPYRPSRTNYFPLILYEMVNQSSQSSPEVS